MKVFSKDELDKLEESIANVSLEEKQPFVELQQPYLVPQPTDEPLFVKREMDTSGKYKSYENCEDIAFMSLNGPDWKAKTQLHELDHLLN